MVENVPLTLNTAVPVEEPILSLTPSTYDVPLPPEVAQQRAYKTSVGLDTAGKSYEQVYGELLRGNEKKLRLELATKLDYEKQLHAQRVIGEVSNRIKRPLTLEDLQFIQDRIINKPSDPGSVIEEEYAKKHISALDSVSFMSDSIMPDARRDIPKRTEEDMLRGQMAKAKQEFAITHVQNSRSAVERQGTPGWLLDQALMLSQIYTEGKLRGQVKDTGFFAGGFLGENLDRQAIKLLQLPWDQYKAEFNRIMDGLNKTNPTAAVKFANAVVGLSTSDKFLDNVFTPLILTGVGTAASFAKGVRTARDTTALTKQIDKAIKDMVVPERPTYGAGIDAIVKPGAGIDGIYSKAATLEAAGDIKEAAIAAASDGVVKTLKGTVNPLTEARDAMHAVFSGAADSIKANPGRFRQEFVNRLVEQYSTAKEALIAGLADIAKVERLPAIFKVEQNIRAIAERMGAEYPGLKNTIIDIPTPYKDSSSNNYFVDIHFGQSGAKLFSNPKTAETFANMHGLKGTIVEQKGLGFYIKVTNPLRETDNVIRDALVATAESKTPDSWLNAWSNRLGRYRTPEDTVSLEQRLNRKVATYAPSELTKIIEESVKDIQTLRGWRPSFLPQKQKWKEWSDVVDEAREVIGPDGVKRLPTSPGEFSDLYQRVKQRLPDEQEVAAYFAYKRGEEIKEVLRVRNAYSNLNRIGAKSWTIQIPDLARESAKIIPMKEATVIATRLEKLPTSSDSMIISRVGQDLRIVDSGELRGAFRTKLEKDIAEGRATVLQVTNPGDRLLADLHPKIGDARVRYIVTDVANSRVLSWNDIKLPKTVDHDYDWTIKQARVSFDSVTRRHIYEDDTSIAHFNLGAMGRDVAQRLDKVRLLIKEGKLAEARAANPLPKDFDEVHSWFVGKEVPSPSYRAFVDSGEREIGQAPLPKPTFTAAKLSLDEPIQLVPRNKTIGDLDNALKLRYEGRDKGFRDGTIEGYGRHFAGERDPGDLFTLKNEGTAHNPLYNVAPVEKVNPVTALNRGLKRAVESTFMDDYKIFSVEHWIKEATPYLKATPEELRDAPFYYFHHPEWKAGRNPEDLMRKNNLETVNFQIKQFIGVQNEAETFLHAWAQKLADVTYEKGGKYPLVPAALLPKLRDPFSFVRSITFDAKLGVFALPQLMVQAQTFSAIFGIAGAKMAAPGSRAAMLHQWSRVNRNPEIIDHLDKLASEGKIFAPGWMGTATFKPGQWKEAYNLLKSTGFANVAGEHVFLDNPMQKNFVSHGGSKFLQWGRLPFTEGERSVRLGAWYTSYLEHRAKNPTGRITDADKAAILDRADLLSINMSRASASKAQTGVWSIPIQFLSYQLRMAELMFSKRLTSLERGRLILTNAALYGVPGAMGLTGLPIGDWYQRQALSEGYVVGQDYAQSAFNEGIPSMLLALTTGNWYNINERFGVQGFDPIKQALTSDRTIWDILGGAAFSTGANTIANFNGFYRTMIGFIRGDEHPLKMEDFTDMFKEVSSISNTAKFIAAINTGRVVSRKEAFLTPPDSVSTGNAIWMYFSGLSPRGVTTMNQQALNREQEKEVAAKGLQIFVKEFRRGLNANSPEEGVAFFKRGFTALKMLGYPEEDYGKAVSIAAEGNESLIESINWDYYTKKVPETRKPAAEKGLVESLKQQQGNK